MIAYGKNKSETIKDIRRLEKNVRARVKEIEEREDLPQFGAESFRKYEKRVQNFLKEKDATRLSQLSEAQLAIISRDIRYLNQLKSTSIKGAIQAKEMYLPIKERLDVLSPEQRHKFWETYNKVVERYAGMDKFKYDIQGVIIDSVYDGEEVDSVVNKIFEQYDTVLEGLGDEATDEKIKIRFTSKLKSL